MTFYVLVRVCALHWPEHCKIRRAQTPGLANVPAPIETAKDLPNFCYVDPAMYQHGQNNLFYDTSVAVAYGIEIPQPGFVKQVNSAGLPMMLVRNQDCNINVFQNVYRHRGMILVDTAKQLLGPITCPYHAWALNLKGALRKTLHLDGPDIHAHD